MLAFSFSTSKNVLPSNRNSKVEYHQHLGTGVVAEEISNDRRSYGGVACFANTDETPQHDKCPKMLKNDASDSFFFILHKRKLF